MPNATSFGYAASILFCIAVSGSSWFSADQAKDESIHRGTRLVLQNNKGSVELAVTDDGACRLHAVKKGLGRIDLQVGEMSKVELVPSVGGIAAGIVSSPDGRILLAVGNGRNSAIMGMTVGSVGFVVGNEEGKKVVTAGVGPAGDGRVVIHHPRAEQAVGIRGYGAAGGRLSIYDVKGAGLTEIGRSSDGFEGLQLFGPLGRPAFGLGWRGNQGMVLMQSRDGEAPASILVQKGKSPLLSGGR
jgi:hypothetical protein